MQFASALIEYLISGIIASVWVVTIINSQIELPLGKINEYKEIFVITYFPVAYILGIYVDVASSFLIRRTKNMHESLIRFEPYSFICRCIYFLLHMLTGSSKEDSYERSAEILSHSPSDLIRTMEAYVSRDRIARGMGLNSLMGSIVIYAILPEPTNQKLATICAVIFIVSFATWHRLRRLSSRFKRVAIEKLNSKKIT